MKRNSAAATWQLSLLFLACLSLSNSSCAPVSVGDLEEPPASVTSVSLLLPGIDLSSTPRNRVFVSAVDQSSNPLNTFKIGNFSITEDGAPGVPEEVGKVEDPLYVTLVIDRSGSMTAGGREAAANTAAKALINALQTGDSASLIEFTDKVTTTVGFTTDLGQVIAAIKSGVSTGTTALYDAVKAGAELLGGVTGRKLLIVLSDGEDTASTTSLDDCILAAQIKGVGVYTVGIGTDFSEDILKRIAEETGASSSGTVTGSDLSTIFLGILTRFNNLVYIKYRMRKTGLLKVFLNYGTMTANASRQTKVEPKE